MEYSEIHSSQSTPHELIKDVVTDYPIEVIDNPENPRIAEVAALDAELFGSHKSLSPEDFQAVINKGGVVLAHVGPDNQLISEASLVLSSDEAGKSTLERSLPGWLGYCDGAAVSKAFRGKGLQKQLLEARSLIAKEQGKEGVAASVRQRNVASIKSMLDSGFVIVADAPGYYGEGLENDRVVLLKDFQVANPLEELEVDDKRLETDEKGFTDLSQLDGRLEQKDRVIALALMQSDLVDQSLNEGISKLLRASYIGVACHDIDVGDSEGDATDSMVFVRIDSLPVDISSRMKQRQDELQSILG